MPPVIAVQAFIWATCYGALKQGPLSLLVVLLLWTIFTVIFVRRASLMAIQLPNIALVAYTLGQDIPDAMADATVFGVNVWVLLGSVLAVVMFGTFLARQPVSRFKGKGTQASETLPSGPMPGELARKQAQEAREAEIRAVYAARGLDYNPARIAPPATRPEMQDFDFNDGNNFHER